jgi:hypothetical protein
VIAARTDVVGSLLRPPELLEARERLERGEIGPPEFKRVEDAAIRLQGGVGLAVVTDGEMRHLSFQSQFTEAVEGFSDAWLAPRLFPRVRTQRLLLEYDDQRSGGFEPLATVPRDKTVVLGLATTKQAAT